MPDTIGRLIKRVAAGTAGNTNAFHDLSALAAGSVLVWNTSDLNLLLLENSFRQLVSAGPWDDVSTTTPGSAARDPTLSDIDWRNPSVTLGACNACYGSHWIAPVGTAPSTFPKIVLKTKVYAFGGGGDVLGVLLALQPGRNAALDTNARVASTRIPGTGGWVAVTLEITGIRPEHLTPVMTPIATGAGASTTAPIVEPCAGLFGTLYFGAYSTGGKSNIGPISIYLAPDT